MAEPLRWGILGTGNIAGQFAAALAGARRGRLVAVGSRRAESAASFAATHRIRADHAHGSYDALLADPAVEAVYLSLPNSMHHDWTLRALAAGKHVLCEKPFAGNAEQAQAMFDAARRAGRVLVEAFMYRSHPLTHLLLEKVRGGAIGELKLIRTSFCYRTTKVADNVRFSRELAGGGLMDVGCYCLSFARLVAGDEPRRVHAAAHLHESGVDDLVAGTLEFDGGVLASFTCGMSVQADNAAEVCGSEGHIRLPVPWKPPEQGAELILARQTPPRMDAAGKPGGGAGAAPRASGAAGGHEVFRVDADKPLYALEADAFAASVRDGAALAVSEADTLGNMRVLDEIRRQIGLRF